MSFYYDDDAPKPLEEIAETFTDCARTLAYDISQLGVDVKDFRRERDMETHNTLRNRLNDLENKAEKLKYLANQLQEISHAFNVINKTVYNPSGKQVSE